MKRSALLLVYLSMLLFACTGHEKDNLRLKEELKAVRDENSYLKAEIVGLQKQLDEVSAKVKEERESLQRKFAEEREEMHKKIREEREALHKKAQEAAKKKSGADRKDQKDTPAPKTNKPV